MKKISLLLIVSLVALVACKTSSGDGDDTPETYTVTYNLNGFTGTAPVDSKTYEEGATVAVQSFSGTNFDGFSLSSSGSVVSSFTMPAHNVTLYGQWKSYLTGTTTYTNIDDTTATVAQTDIYQKNGSGSYYLNGTVASFDGSESQCFLLTVGSTKYLNRAFLNTNTDGTGVTFSCGTAFKFRFDSYENKVRFGDATTAVDNTTAWRPMSEGTFVYTFEDEPTKDHFTLNGTTYTMN
jgi:hypothetical protein